MTRSTSILLRISLAFALLYPAVSAVFEPYSWVGYFPAFLQDLPVNDMLMLHIFGALEVILALWILSGKKIFLPSTLSALMLAGIIFFNWSQLAVLFRDVSIMLLAVALAFDSYNR